SSASPHLSLARTNSSWGEMIWPWHLLLGSRSQSSFLLSVPGGSLTHALYQAAVRFTSSLALSQSAFDPRATQRPEASRPLPRPSGIPPWFPLGAGTGGEAAPVMLRGPGAGTFLASI